MDELEGPKKVDEENATEERSLLGYIDLREEQGQKSPSRGRHPDGKNGFVHHDEEAMDVDDEKKEEGEPVEGDSPVRPPRIIEEEEVIRLNEERWPNVNGVYDAQGEWHDWSELTYSYSYDNSELIILPYTACIINLPGQQYVTESSSN